VHRLTAAPGVGSSYPSGLVRRVRGILLIAHSVRLSPVRLAVKEHSVFSDGTGTAKPV